MEREAKFRSAQHLTVRNLERLASFVHDAHVPAAVHAFAEDRVAANGKPRALLERGSTFGEALLELIDACIEASIELDGEVARGPSSRDREAEIFLEVVEIGPKSEMAAPIAVSSWKTLGEAGSPGSTVFSLRIMESSSTPPP